MSETRENPGQDVERGYAEEESGVPASEMEREVSRPPEERWSGHAETGEATDDTRGDDGGS
jgi:hypothetical protein